MAYLPPLNGGRLNASISGNTTGTASFLSTGNLILAGGNNVTLSQSGNTISFNAPTGGAAPAIVGGGGTFSSGSLSLNGAGGLSIISGNGPALNFSAPAVSYLSGGGAVGLSTNGATISITAPTQSLQTQNNVQAISAGTASAATGTIVFGNSNNINFGLSGQTVTASYVGAAGGAGSNTFGAGSMSSNNNVSGNQGYISGSNLQFAFAGGNNVTLSQSISAGSATITVSGPSFSNSNNVSLGTINNGGSAYVTASANFNVSASNTSTNLSGIIFANSNGINFGLNGNVVTASGTPDGIQSIAGGTSTVTNAGVTFSGSNNIQFGLSNGVMTASANVAAGGGGNTLVAGGSTFNSTGSIIFSGASGPITVSGSSNSINFGVPAVSSLSATGALSIATNGTVVSIGAPAAATISNWEPNLLQNVSLSNSAYGAKTAYFFKLQVPGNVYASQLLQLVSATASTSSNSTGAYSLSMQAAIYTANGSTLSMITQSSGSNSYSFSASGTSGSGNYIGLRGVSIPLNVSFSGGNYWIGLWSNSTYTNMTGYFSNMSVINNNYSYNGFFNQANNNTQGIQEGVGYYSVTTNALPTAAPMSQILGQSVFANGRIPYLNFKNLTW